jgi:hypothetical protein
LRPSAPQHTTTSTCSGALRCSGAPMLCACMAQHTSAHLSTALEHTSAHLSTQDTSAQLQHRGTQQPQSLLRCQSASVLDLDMPRLSCCCFCRLDVEQYKDVRRDEFVEKYTSLVQRLSLLLLQVRACCHLSMPCAPPALSIFWRQAGYRSAAQPAMPVELP